MSLQSIEAVRILNIPQNELHLFIKIICMQLIENI